MPTLTQSSITENTPGPPSGGLVALFGVTSLIGVAALLFMMASVWWGTTAMVSAIAAAGLTEGRAFDPTAFKVGWYLALALNVGLLGWAALRRIVGMSPWGPLLSLALIWTVGGSVAFIQNVYYAPLPVALSAMLLLGFTSLWQYGVPAFILWFNWRIFRSVWSTGRASTAGAKRGIGVFVLVFLGCVSLIGVGYAAQDMIARLDAIPPTNFLDSPSEDFQSYRQVGGSVQEARQSLASVSAPRRPRQDARPTSKPSGRSSFAPASTRGMEPASRTTYHDCMNELFHRKEGGEPFLDAQKKRLRRRGLRSGVDAHDVVMDTLGKVCERHEEEGIDVLHTYYVRAVNNNMNRACKVAGRLHYVEDIDAVEGIGCDLSSGGVTAEVSLEYKKLMAVLSAEEYRFVAKLAMEGFTCAELAKSWNITADSCRQKRKRALDKMRNKNGLLR